MRVLLSTRWIGPAYRCAHARYVRASASSRFARTGRNDYLFLVVDQHAGTQGPKTGCSAQDHLAAPSPLRVRNPGNLPEEPQRAFEGSRGQGRAAAAGTRPQGVGGTRPFRELQHFAGMIAPLAGVDAYPSDEYQAGSLRELREAHGAHPRPQRSAQLRPAGLLLPLLPPGRDPRTARDGSGRRALKKARPLEVPQPGLPSGVMAFASLTAERIAERGSLPRRSRRAKGPTGDGSSLSTLVFWRPTFGVGVGRAVGPTRSARPGSARKSSGTSRPSLGVFLPGGRDPSQCDGGGFGSPSL